MGLARSDTHYYTYHRNIFQHFIGNDGGLERNQMAEAGCDLLPQYLGWTVCTISYVIS